MGFLISLFVGCILSYIFEFKFFLINTFKSEHTEYVFAYTTVVVLGCLLMLLNIKTLLFTILPWSIWEKMPFRNFIHKSGMAQAEQCIKQAAVFKTIRIVSNALGHHQGVLMESMSSRISSKTSSRAGMPSFGVALLNFQATSHLCEPAGGIFSGLKGMWNGSLFREEGVWIHSRLYAMNLTQWFVAVFNVIGMIYVERLIVSLYDMTAAPVPIIYDLQAEVDEFIPAYVGALEQFLLRGNDFISLLWENMTTIRPDLVKEFGGGILNNTS